jgi:hypothetical protein
MAEGKIKYEDLFDSGLVAKLTQLKAEMQAVKNELKSLPGKLPKSGSQAGDVEKLNTVQRERIKLQQKLDSLNDKEVKTNLELKQQIQERLKQEKESIKNKGIDASSMTIQSQKLRDLKKQYRDLSKAERENVKVGGEILKSIKAQDKKMKELDGSLGDHQRNVGDYKNSVISAFQQMGIPVGGVTKLLQAQTVAQEGLTAANAAGTKGLKLFRLALISTGIGAVVAAIGALAAGFLSTQRGVDAVNRALTPLRVVFQRIWGIVQELGTGMVDAFNDPKQAIINLWEALKTNIINRFTGIADQFGALGKIIKSAFNLDWEGIKEGAAELGESTIQVLTGVDDLTGKVTEGFNSLGKEINTAYEEGKRLAEIKVELEELAIQTALEEGKLNRIFQEQRTILNDVNKSNEERLAAADKAIAASEKAKQLKLQELELLIEEQELKMKQNDSDREAQLELAKLQAQRDEIEATNLKENLRIRNTANSVIKAQEAERLKAIKDQADAKKKWGEEYFDFVKTLETDLLEFEQMITDEADKLSEEAMEKEIARQIQQTKVAHEEAEKQIAIAEMKEAAKLSVAKDVAGALMDISGEQSVLYKVAATTQAVIDTYTSANAAYKAMAGIPVIGPTLAAIAAAAAITSGLANVAKINGVQFEKGEVDISGPRHSQGGIPAEIEGGESVINRTGTANARKTLQLINDGKLGDAHIIPMLAMSAARVPGVNVNNDFSEMVSRQDKTNELLKKFKFMSADGKKVMDINGNVINYV